MEENETVDPEYIKGFNEGYLIGKHMPELSGQLGNSMGKTERGEGFRNGLEQFVSERHQQVYPDWMKSDWQKNMNKGTQHSQEKSQDQTKNKEDLEPDI